MDPASALAIGSAAAGFGSGFFAPEGQELEGFSGSRHTTDPFTGQNRRQDISAPEALADAMGNTQSGFGQAIHRAQQPVTLENTLPSAFVQQPATFSGGGLPFDVGVTAFDPANPFYSPTPPPGGFSDSANALLAGMRSGAAGPGAGSAFANSFVGSEPDVDGPNERNPNDPNDKNPDGRDSGGGGGMPTFNNPAPWTRTPTTPAQPFNPQGLPPVTMPPSGGEGEDGPGQGMPGFSPGEWNPQAPEGPVWGGPVNTYQENPFPSHIPRKRTDIDAGVSFDGRAAMLQNLEQAGMPPEMIAKLRGGQ